MNDVLLVSLATFNCALVLPPVVALTNLFNGVKAGAAPAVVVVVVVFDVVDVIDDVVDANGVLEIASDDADTKVSVADIRSNTAQNVTNSIAAICCVEYCILIILFPWN